jgi:N-methylhydantoinase A/oxoprolinase/acetone carboxylase beta subunit/N-methylhydantoinase B/oxoprolinase/acetone carboxylase alpha subunit
MNHYHQPRLAIDIGGTFTDIAIAIGDEILTAKILTTFDNPVDGVLQGIEYAMQQVSLAADSFSSVIHGTTLATNALIEQRGAKVGVVTTEGFRDILEIGYERRYDQYDINIEKKDLLVPRDLVFTVAERSNVSGKVLVPLNEKSLIKTVDALLDAGVDSVAICLLHSYKNPTHETMIRRALAEHAPGLPVSLSSEVSPEIREFDRLCTTVCNAYIKPLMAGYLQDLESALKEQGFTCPLFIVTSGGGITTLETAMSFPIRLVESGPSGGAILAAKIAEENEIANVLSFDMGGTTAKVCLIDDHAPRTSRSFEIDRRERFLKGSGIPTRIPVIEMIEIGAGGGSIAGVDSLGRLRVGPKSASANPGPACYGRGGKAPTVTDADVAIGFIDPATFAEGRLELRPELSRAAIEKTVSKPLEISVVAGADGISKTVDEAMANAARMHAVEQGKNLAECTMVAFGGNGPLHATRVAEKVGISKIIIPPNPSVGSAVGFLFAPVCYEIVRSYHALIKAFPFDAINAMLTNLEAEATTIVIAGAAGEPLSIKRIAFMRYAGQGHEIEVSIPAGDISKENLGSLINVFESEYTSLFSRAVPDMEVEVLNWSVSVSTTATRPVRFCETTGSAAATPSATRSLALDNTGEEVEANVYWRAELNPGEEIIGPALIVEPQTTTFVSSAFHARIDNNENIILARVTEQPVDMPAASTRAEIDLQVMWDRLLAIVEEQGQVLMRTAFSPIVRECGDISAGIFDIEGRMLAQAVTGTPGHVNTMAGAVSDILPYFPLQDMRPGDVYMTNDPWLGSGHLNDIVLFAPIFHHDRLVALTACTSHVYDLGGLGMGPDGSDVFDEGLYLPPLKLVDRGEVNQMIIDIMKANSRSPVANEGDFYALIACCDIAALRLSEMLGEFSMSNIDELATHILSTSKRATVAAISKIPAGVYENELITDGYDFEILLKAKMTVFNNTILTDFNGSSGHSARGINVPIKYTAAYAVFAMRCLVGSNIPNNAGSLAPFKFDAPENCILNAQYPAPVAMRHNVGHMVSDLVFGCIHQAMPGTAPAEGASCLWDLPLRSPAQAALNANKATVFATELCHSGGMGARPTKDGLSATAYPSGLFGTPVEIAESTAPVTIHRRELICDSGGAGEYRGGLGQFIELESSENESILLFTGVERTRYPARGRDGGQQGSVGRISLRSGPKLAGKGEQVIPAGDLLYWETPGGGGDGNPLQRDADTVALDVRLGLVSKLAALDIYGIVLHDDGSVDARATEVQRTKLARSVIS